MSRREQFRQIEQLRIDDFLNPPAFYYPNYLWVWNDCLTKENISEQLGDMRSRNVKGVWVLPMPKNFRPNSQPTNMEPDYLTDEYLEIYRYMVQEAHRLGMKVWLYDEGGWPSGMAAGRIAKENPAFAQQSLERQELTPVKGETVLIPKDCLAAFLKCGEKLVKKLPLGRKEKINRDDCQIEIYYAKRQEDVSLSEPIHSDLLNPKVTREFIRLTHEAYKSVLNDSFGFDNTIPLVFTDEPKVPNPPWTDDLAVDFKREKGYDIREHLPAIFSPDKKDGMQARVDFFDWWSNRFADAFFGQIQKWCHKNKLFFAGHLDQEDSTIGARMCGYGHILRIFRKMDIPGVDTIWRQIFPDQKKKVYPHGCKYSIPINENHHFPKYASSVAHQEGKPWVITESFGAYGSGLTPEQMKWITDFQYVRGINITNVSCYQLSTKDYFMGAIRPLNGHRNSIWKHMDIYHNYVARTSYLLSQGKPDIDIAVYYPVRDIWAGGPDVENIAHEHDALIKALLENQCDFDLIDDDILERRSTQITDGNLQVGQMRYHTVCVSKTRWMTEMSKAKLSEFAQKGGILLWMDDASNRPTNSISPDLRRLKTHVNPLVQLTTEQTALRVCKRRLENGNLYFITNEDIRKSLKCVVNFNESLPLFLLDPETGACCHPSEAVHANGVWSLPIDLSFAGSCVILFSKEHLPLAPHVPKTSKTLFSIEQGWLGRRLKSYRIGKSDFEIEDDFNENPVPVTLGDWRKIFGDGFSGDVDYNTTIECDSATVEKAAFLDLGKVNYACELFLNGESLGRRAWQPFVFSVKGELREGRNEIRVVVTNTMANQFVTTKELDKWPANVIGPYHKKALCFEPDSLPSGLFGPVRMQAGKTELKGSQ